MAPSLGIYYGSQTGCAESIAKRIYDEALEKEIDATFGPLNDLHSSKALESPAAEPMHIVVVCSTTGNGDPPDNCAKLWRYLKRRTQPKDMLANVVYTVLGLGDTNYDKFCYMGKSLDKRMSELGAQRFFDMCDTGADDHETKHTGDATADDQHGHAAVVDQSVREGRENERRRRSYRVERLDT